MEDFNSTLATIHRPVVSIANNRTIINVIMHSSLVPQYLNNSAGPILNWPSLHASLAINI
jgi:hypothetical protein